MRLVFLVFLATILIVPALSLAKTPPPSNPIGSATSGSVGKKEGATLSTVVRGATTVINWFSWLVAIIAVVIGLYAGFLFITARDDSSQLTTARNTMFYAIIGVAVAVLSFSIVAITRSLLGL